MIVARWPEGLAMEHFFTKILGPHAALRPVGPRRFDEGLECATKGAELFCRPLREQGAAGHQGGGAMGSRATDVRVCFWQPGDTQASDAVRRRRRCAHLHVEPCRGRQTLYNTRGLGLEPSCRSGWCVCSSVSVCVRRCHACVSCAPRRVQCQPWSASPRAVPARVALDGDASTFCFSRFFAASRWPRVVETGVGTPTPLQLPTAAYGILEFFQRCHPLDSFFCLCRSKKVTRVFCRGGRFCRGAVCRVVETGDAQEEGRRAWGRHGEEVPSQE